MNVELKGRNFEVGTETSSIRDDEKVMSQYQYTHSDGQIIPTKDQIRKRNQTIRERI